MTSTIRRDADEMAEEVLLRLRASRLGLLPKRVLISVDTDQCGEDAWRLVLVLPKPDGQTWDRTAVFRTRMAATTAFDDVVGQADQQLPGRTLASITTDEASEKETAPEDVPLKGEDPGREA